MREVAVYCRGTRCADAVLRQDGGRVEIRAEIPDPGDGLYRAVLVCRRGKLSLGVLQPEDGKLMLRRRPEKSEVARLGEIVSVQVGCSFPFAGKVVWEKTDQPAQLLQDDFFCHRLERCAFAWWRREQGRLLVALPMSCSEPFPLETIFCFARVERVEGELCAVYAFDAAQQPQMPTTCAPNKKI